MNIVTKNNWELSSSGLAAGTIYFTLDDGFCFPYENNSDFPIVCIETWIDNLTLFLKKWVEKQQGKRKKEFAVEMCFFDGPYSYRLVYMNKTSISIIFYRYDDKLKEIVINLLEFCSLIVQKGISLIIIAESFNIGTEQIRKSLKYLNEMIRYIFSHSDGSRIIK